MGTQVSVSLLKAETEKYVNSFVSVLYEEDDIFMRNMQTKNLGGDDIARYRYWEWTQGVGLYGIWKLFAKTGDTRYLQILENYYEKCFAIGLPAKNINTVTPMLTLSFLAEHLQNETYRNACLAWAEAVLHNLPKTPEGGLQHKTSDTLNEGELWDDTLYMTVLFLANMGRIHNRSDFAQEAEYQFLLHAKYLANRETGLWYHGWTFEGRHNFAGAFWGRGNCWITMAIPEYIEISGCCGSIRRYLGQLWCNQVETLVKLQAPSGMWHTLLDDATSYEEASATCGIGYGILKGASLGLGQPVWAKAALKALPPILQNTDENGILHQVSYGTAMGRENKQFYKDIELRPMPYGQALAMLFLHEAECFINK